MVDSTGIKVEGDGEWHARKHDGSKRRVWRKIHLGMDEQTLEVRAVEVTGSHIGDSLMLPELLDQILADQEVGSVTADGAYDTRNCHDAIADCGAHAVVPPRGNAKPWKTSTKGAVARNEALQASKYLGRALATMKRIPPPKSRRDQDAFYEPKVREAKLMGQAYGALVVMRTPLLRSAGRQKPCQMTVVAGGESDARWRSHMPEKPIPKSGGPT